MDQNLVHFGAYWMLISLEKIILVIFLHQNGYRNRIMALSCLKTSFLGSKNQFFGVSENFLKEFFFKIFFAELQIW